MADDQAPGSGRGEDPASGAAGHPARGFAADGPLDTALPGTALTQRLDRASGPERECAGASDDEMFGMLGRWEATEAWCVSAKLGVIRALIRRRTPDGCGFSSDMVEGLVQEISNQIGVSLRAADALLDLAWTLDTRLVLTRRRWRPG
jgi:hypothetical protein